MCHIKLKIIALTIISVICINAEEAKKPSVADEIINKAIADNTKESEKLYSDYINSLDVAGRKVLKVLDSARADLNDVKKGKWSLTERADAIKAIDVKIQQIKELGLGESVQGRVVTKGGPNIDLARAIVGEWKIVATNGWKSVIVINKEKTANCGNKIGIWTIKGGDIELNWGDSVVVYKPDAKCKTLVGISGDVTLTMTKSE